MLAQLSAHLQWGKNQRKMAFPYQWTSWKAIKVRKPPGRLGASLHWHRRPFLAPSVGNAHDKVLLLGFRHQRPSILTAKSSSGAIHRQLPSRHPRTTLFLTPNSVNSHFTIQRLPLPTRNAVSSHFRIHLLPFAARDSVNSQLTIRHLPKCRERRVTISALPFMEASLLDKSGSATPM